MKKVKGFFLALWNVLHHNLWLKLASVFFALVFWNFALAEVNPLQSVTLKNISVQVQGLETLTSSRDLALSNPDQAEGRSVNVQVEINRDEVSLLTEDQVRVTLDLSTITSSGKQLVALTARSTLGSVVKITPAYVELQIEPLLRRSIPVQYRNLGTLPESNWLSEPALTPESLTVTGPESKVNQLSYAMVEVPIYLLTESYVGASEYTLYDNTGAIMNDLGGLTITPLSVMVRQKLLSTAILPIEVIVIGGQDLLPGFSVGETAATPATVEIAGSTDLLSSLEKISTAAIDISGQTENFSTDIPLILPQGAYFVDTSVVRASVAIHEVSATRTFDVPVAIEGVSEYSFVSQDHVKITFSGPRSLINNMTEEDFTAYVNASFLLPGEHDLLIQIRYKKPGLEVLDTVLGNLYVTIKIPEPKS